MIYFTYTVRTALAVAFLLYFPSIIEAQVSIYAMILLFNQTNFTDVT